MAANEGPTWGEPIVGIEFLTYPFVLAAQMALTGGHLLLGILGCLVTLACWLAPLAGALVRALQGPLWHFPRPPQVLVPPAALVLGGPQWARYPSALLNPSARPGALALAIARHLAPAGSAEWVAALREPGPGGPSAPLRYALAVDHGASLLAAQARPPAPYLFRRGLAAAPGAREWAAWACEDVGLGAAKGGYRLGRGLARSWGGGLPHAGGAGGGA